MPKRGWDERTSSASVLTQKFVTQFSRQSGQAGDSSRDPESRKIEGFWIPASAGMTVMRPPTSLANFWDTTLG